MQRYGASQTQACAVLRISRSVYGYRSRARGARPLVARIREIAATRVHYGYRRVHVLLRREGWRDNCKRVYRLYRAEGLSLRHCRPRRNKSARLRQPQKLVSTMNEIWSMRKLPLQVDSSKLEFPPRANALGSALAAGSPTRRAV
jgi:putative transposase